MHQLLNFQLARQNAASPSTVRGLDDLLEKFPELIHSMTEEQAGAHQKQYEDSPTLGRRPSLDTQVDEADDVFSDDGDDGLNPGRSSSTRIIYFAYSALEHQFTFNAWWCCVVA